MISEKNVETSVSLYLDGWNAKTAADVKEKFMQCLAPDVTYTDTNTPKLTGIDRIVDLVMQSYDKVPGRSFDLPATPEFFANQGRYRWVINIPGQGAHDGMDFFEYNDDNLITRLVGFLTPLA